VENSDNGTPLMPIMAELVVPSPPKPFPGLGGAILLLVILFGLQMIGAVPLGICMAICQQGKPMSEQSMLLTAGMGIIALGSFALLIGGTIAISRRPWREALPLRRFPPAVLLPMVPALLGMIILVSDADNLIRSVLPVNRFFQELFASLSDLSIPGVVLLVVVAPLTEELLFRGLILTAFLPRYGMNRAVVYSAILFAVMHLNPYQASVGIAMGMLLGWLFVRTRSLWPCIIAHGLFNAHAPVARWLSDHTTIHIQGFIAPMMNPAVVEFQPTWLDGLGAVLLVVGVLGIMATTRTRTLATRGTA
jgi:uncharacterized protein